MCLQPWPGGIKIALLICSLQEKLESLIKRELQSIFEVITWKRMANMDFKGKIFLHQMGIKGYGADYGSSFKLFDIQKAFDGTSPAESHSKNKFGSHRRKYPMVRTNCIHLLFMHGNLIKHSLPQWHPNTFQTELYLGLCFAPWRGRFCHTLGSGSLKILRSWEQRGSLAAVIKNVN